MATARIWESLPGVDYPTDTQWEEHPHNFHDACFLEHVILGAKFRSQGGESTRQMLKRMREMSDFPGYGVGRFSSLRNEVIDKFFATLGRRDKLRKIYIAHRYSGDDPHIQRVMKRRLAEAARMMGK